MMYVAAYKGTRDANPKARLGDRLICWWTGEPHSHCELVVQHNSEGMSLCVSATLRKDGVGGRRGVRTKWIDLSTGRWDIRPAPHSWPQRDALEWAIEHKGSGYDIPGFARLGLRLKRWLRPLAWLVPSVRRWWFCSEVTALLADLPGDPVNYTPTGALRACEAAL